MTKREASIVSAFTGIMLGDFSDLHKYVEEIMERPVFIHEMGDRRIASEIKENARNGFTNLIVE